MNQDNPPELPPRPPTLLSLSPRAQAVVHPTPPPPPPPPPAPPAPHAPAYQSPSSASAPSQTGITISHIFEYFENNNGREMMDDSVVCCYRIKCEILRFPQRILDTII